MKRKRKRSAARRSTPVVRNKQEPVGGPDDVRREFTSMAREMGFSVDDPSPWPTREELRDQVHDSAFATALMVAEHSLVLAYLEDYENEELPGHIYIGRNGESVAQSEREWLYGHLQEWGSQGRLPQVCGVCGGPFPGGPAIIYPLGKYKAASVLNLISEVPDAVVGSEVHNWAVKVCSPQCWASARMPSEAALHDVEPALVEDLRNTLGIQRRDRG